MDKEQFLIQKTDEFYLMLPKWGDLCQRSPYTAIVQMRNFFETIYDAGAATQRVVIRGRDIQNLLDKDKESQQ